MGLSTRVGGEIKMSEKIIKILSEDLWNSFAYNSPEEHAPVLYNIVAKSLIKEFLEDIKELVRHAGYDSLYTHKLRYKWEEKLK